MGNLSIWDIGDDTGEPFLIAVNEYPTLALLSPIDEPISISCTAKSFVYNSVPMEYLDNAAKTVHINSDTITLEKAEEIINSNCDLVIWGDYTFTYVEDASSTSGDGVFTRSIALRDTNGNDYGIDYENDVFDIGKLVLYASKYPSKYTGLKSYIAVSGFQPYIQINPGKITSGNATEDVMFAVGNDGMKNRAEFRVLGNGTVKAYSIILPSTTANSTKKFRITVDDTGTISATEVT